MHWNERLVGRLVGDTYELQRIIGTGPHGTTFCAHDRRHDQTVALKLTESRDGPRFAWLRDKLARANQLASGHLARVIDVNQLDDGRRYVVTRHVSGCTLAEHVRRDGPYSTHDVLALLDRLESILSELHRCGLVHGGIKPSNVMLTGSDRRAPEITLLDLGIAQAMAGVERPAHPDDQFAAPELATTTPGDETPLADIYSLAASLCAAAGRLRGPVPAHVQADALTGEWEPLRRALLVAPPLRTKSVRDLYNEFAHAVRETPNVQSPRGAVAVTGTMVLSQALATSHLTSLVQAALWSPGAPRPSELLFVAPDDGFLGTSDRELAFALTHPNVEYEYALGSRATVGKHTNDFVLPHRKVSRHSLSLRVRSGRTYLRRSPACSVPVRVGFNLLERGEEHPLHHGQSIAVGVVAGVFYDGRYQLRQPPAHAIDELTGLLARDGLAWEMAFSATAVRRRRLVLAALVGPDASPDAVADIATQLHVRHPRVPIARVGTYVAMLVDTAMDPSALAGTVNHTTPIAFGHLDLVGPSQHAAAKLDEAIGAMTRAHASLRGPAIIPLADYALEPMAADEFAAHTKPLADSGAEIGLLALAEAEKLAALGDEVHPALEQELLQLVGQVVGPHAHVAKLAPGVIGYADPKGNGHVATSVSSRWRERGCIREGSIAIDRTVHVGVVAGSELDRIGARAAELARAPDPLRDGAESLPTPIAVHLGRALAAVDPLAQTRHLVDAIVASWRFLALFGASLHRVGLALGDGMPSRVADDGRWPAPWLAYASAGALAVLDVPGPVGQLIRATFGADGQPAAELERATRVGFDAAADLTHTRPDARASLAARVDGLRQATEGLVQRLAPLQSWTLIHVHRADRHDARIDRVTYVEHTGQRPLAATRELLVPRAFSMVEPVVYLAHLGSDLVVPLEPYVRCHLSAWHRTQQMFWCENPIEAAGPHTYRSVFDDETCRLCVADAQLHGAIVQH